MAAKYRPETLDRLSSFLDSLGALLRNKRQRASFALYAMGLLNEGERKSMEPIAARASCGPEEANALHYRLVHFISSDAWQDAPMRAYAVNYAIEAMQSHVFQLGLYT